MPFLPSVPVVPIIAADNERVYSMFEHFLRYPRVHDPVRYEDVEHLLSIVDKRVIDVGFAEAMKARGIPNAKLPRAPKTRRPRKHTARAKPRSSASRQGQGGLRVARLDGSGLVMATCCRT